MACEFSAPYAHSSPKNIIFSPNSQYLAYTHSGINLCIRFNQPSTSSSQQQQAHHPAETIHHIFSCIDKIDKIEFSKDSEYIYCAIYNRATVQIFSLTDLQWRCRINESIAGMVSVTWAPDSRHVLVESDFGIQLAIWSLLENTSYIIHSPKPNCITFSDCQRCVLHLLTFFPHSTVRYLAVGHRIECKDHVGIYSTSPWNELNKFRTRTTDFVALHWTPSGTHLVVLDSHLYYRIMVYTPAGEVCP